MMSNARRVTWERVSFRTILVHASAYIRSSAYATRFSCRWVRKLKDNLPRVPFESASQLVHHLLRPPPYRPTSLALVVALSQEVCTMRDERVDAPDLQDHRATQAEEGFDPVFRGRSVSGHKGRGGSGS